MKAISELSAIIIAMHRYITMYLSATHCSPVSGSTEAYRSNRLRSSKPSRLTGTMME